MKHSLKKLSTYLYTASLTVAFLSLLLINAGVASAASETVVCSGSFGSPTAVTEGDYVADDMTFSGTGYCLIDATFNPLSIDVNSGTFVMTRSATTVTNNVDVDGTMYVDDPLSAAAFTINSGGIVTHTDEDIDGVDLTVTSLNIVSGGRIDVLGRGCEGGGRTTDDTGAVSEDGYSQSSTDDTSSCQVGIGGAGLGFSNTGGGGSYGGIAANSGVVYGDELNATFLGAGGGRDLIYGNGGDGGGKVKVVASGAITINGSMTANGEEGERDQGFTGGGGSGGSISLTAATIAGSGNVTAVGGIGRTWTHQSDGGGGGRIFFDAATLTFDSNNVSVAGGAGGSGKTDGYVGSFVVESTANNYSVYCQGASSTPTLPIAAVYGTGDTLTFADQFTSSASAGYCQLDAAYSVVALTIDSGVTISHIVEDTTGVDFTTTGALTISSGGNINVDGLGCRGGSGGLANSGFGPDTSGDGSCTEATSGAGIFFTSLSFGGSGGSYGGLGGYNSAGTVSSTGETYGNEASPSYLGSGGSQGNDPSLGGYGGGLVTLDVGGTLTIDGSLTADGGDGTDSGSYSGGGGSGGGIFLTVGSLAGAGTLSADGGNGGNGSTNDSGGGAGGRIAVITSGSDTFDYYNNATVAAGVRGGDDATVGTGPTDGAEGTIYPLPAAIPEFPTYMLFLVMLIGLGFTYYKFAPKGASSTA